MKTKAQIHRENNKRLRVRSRRIERRLSKRDRPNQTQPVFSASNIQYELADRSRGLSAGGIGLIHSLVQRLNLPKKINHVLKLLKQHHPYWESDHVLNIAYNSIMGGTCLEDIGNRRSDEVFLDALGANTIPGQSTAGDFCRRFTESDVLKLQEVFNQTRMKVWKKQPKDFFREAIIEADGTLLPTTGNCKEGMDISYNGVWGYHPLIVSLENTQEPLYIINRSGNRHSHEESAEYLDRSIDLCREAGFRKITLRGDTAFSQTWHFDGWDEDGVNFVFGFDAIKKVQEIAANLPPSDWSRLHRRQKHSIKTEARQRPENIKKRIVREREFKAIHLQSEDVAEFEYQPNSCKRSYRMVVVRKNLSIEKGEKELFDDIRYFFYITNDKKSSSDKIVFSANDRCNQENLIKQLKSGVGALHAPVNTFVGNWAYMVITTLAWSLKAWLALSLPETGRWAQKHREEKQTVLKMGFKTFAAAFIQIPAQVIKTGRRIVFRLLAWNRWQHVFLRAVERLSYPSHW